ncbi:hypothetical protein SmJEL517_g00328 [Synchytrium microbalum]|uniref:Glucosamine 6-phosphate N-acetyltransferase n=1 Tax=Synchytrium microbalum TaxID=1806994 RepID=A0A507CFC7_9FUNG|nr:uncharacterized protein SmJEL517_g00328 [Synchytrium microbalum]TPX38332.1 hypothetical protein SmJEL517_g00328 [Synchytrium microbalum]
MPIVRTVSNKAESMIMPAKSSLISDAIQSQLPDGYSIRKLQLEDYDKGLLSNLAQLSTVGDASKAAFEEMFNYMQAHSDTYYPMVVEELATGNIVGSGTVFIERKFLHGCGKAAHIEDVVVSSSMRGKSLGKHIIETLKNISKESGCYKVILDCAEHNVAFYEKCGFSMKGSQMACYFDH